MLAPGVWSRWRRVFFVNVNLLLSVSGECGVFRAAALHAAATSGGKRTGTDQSSRVWIKDKVSERPKEMTKPSPITSKENLD